MQDHADVQTVHTSTVTSDGFQRGVICWIIPDFHNSCYENCHQCSNTHTNISTRMSASRTTSALVPYAGRPSQEVMETLAATVSKNTRAGYTRESVSKFHYLALRQRCWRIHPGFGVGIPPPSQYKRCGDESAKKQKESTVGHNWACIKSEWCGSKLPNRSAKDFFQSFCWIFDNPEE